MAKLSERALQPQNENHEAGNKYIPYGKMASWLVEWKNATETQWLKDSPSQPLQQSLKDLERAYKNFFQKEQRGGNEQRPDIHHAKPVWDPHQQASQQAADNRLPH